MTAPARRVRFDVLTLFPELFRSYVGQSLLKLAIQERLVEVHCWDMRDWSSDKHQKMDDRPFGGGPGMVIKPEPVLACWEDVQAKGVADGWPEAKTVMLTPAGRRLRQPVVAELATHERIILLCGRYEGFDDRVRQLLDPIELSVGDFVCNGGEVPAMIVIDTVIRLIPGVLGQEESLAEESHNEPGELEYPQFTRPRVFRGLEVPGVLLSGDHDKIAKWRAAQSETRSAAGRELNPE